MNKIIIAFVLAFMISSSTFGQVGEIIKELGEVRSKERYSNFGSSNGSSEWLLL